MKRLHADVELTNTQGKLVASESARRKDKSKTMLQQNEEGRYDAAGTTTAEVIERDDCEQNSWTMSRQCSGSTMDTHAKIRWWFESELKQSSSPEILKLTKCDPADQKSSPPRQKEESKLSPGPLISCNNQDQNPGSSVVSKAYMSKTVPRKRVKKVSVAVDATPTARIASMLCKPVKDISGDESGQAPETMLDLKNDALKNSVHSALLPPHPPEANRVLIKRDSPANAQACSLENNSLCGEHCETENDVLPQTISLMPNAKPISSPSGNKTHNTCSKRESSKVANNNMDKLSTTPSAIKIKSHGAKKDVGITATPDPLEPEYVKVTLRDGASNDDEELSVLNSLDRNHRTNVPGFASLEQNVVNRHEEQTDCAEETACANAVGARRLSLPPHMFWPSAKHRETEVGQSKKCTERRGHNNKFTLFLQRRRPSTTGRKPSNATPLPPFKKNKSLQQSIQAGIQTLPTCETDTHNEEHPLTPVCRHQEPHNSTSSVVTAEVQSADNQNTLPQQLAPTTIRRTEAVTEMSPLREILIHNKQRAPAKVSVGTSTSSLILSEGTNTGVVRHVESKSDGVNQKDRDNAEGSTSEHKG
jgi:hypothetical protein